MAEANPSEHPSPSSIWTDLEQIVFDFEEAWQSGTPPSIDAFLQEAEVDSPSLVAQLVESDLENRWKAGEPVRVEGYFRRYPKLAEDRSGAIRLITAEYALRRRREPELAPDEFLERFPEYREDLAACLEGPHRPKDWTPPRLNCPHCRQPISLGQERGGQDLSCSACGHSFRLETLSSVTGTAEELSRLGRFELLGVVGEGGYGKVYRARDLRLGRIVAVKVPRGRRSLPEELDQFLREARSAARLAHVGIVPIYEVELSGTLPYIVSAFIQGRTLAAEISARRLRFREAADVVAQVAEALAYAHARGVIHRDLKPSNIMLGRMEGSEGGDSPHPQPLSPGGRGVGGEGVRAFVMDFGLAVRPDGEVRVTLDGTILGTPTYMSPEQARGENRQVDGRSDVYSLGVVLYELLTGEPPFRGVFSAVLEQIQHEEPQPPHRLNDKIPRDLETITLKCLAKEPGRRYQSAGELAADLRRFLRHEPILARPAGRLERTWRWARRNPVVAGLSAAVVLLAVGATVAAALFYQQRQAAVRATADATRARLQAEKDRDLAEDRENLTLKAHSRFVFQVQELLRDSPAHHLLRQNLLRLGLEGLEEVARTSHTSRGDHSRVSAHSLLGDILLILGKTAEARRQYEQAYTIARSLADAHPDNGIAQRDLYLVYGKLGHLSHRTGDLLGAVQFHRQALALAQSRANGPAGKDDARYDMIYTLNDLGKISLEQGNLGEARQRFRQALELAEAMAKAHPNTTPSRQALAVSCENLGDLGLHAGRADKALNYYQRALDLRDALTAAEPENFPAQRYLAALYQRVGDAHRDQAQLPAALDRYQKSLQNYEALAAKDPGNTGIQTGLTVAYDRLAQVNSLLGDARAALDFYQKSLEQRKGLAVADPENAQTQYELAVACSNVGLFAVRTHEFGRAAESYRRGLEILRRLLDAGKLVQPQQAQQLRLHLEHALPVAEAAPRAVEDLAFALSRPPDQLRELMQIRTEVLARRGRYDEAAATAEKLQSLAPAEPSERRDWLYDVACCYTACLAALTRGKEPNRLMPEEEALKARFSERAIAALAGAVDLGYRDVGHILGDQDLAPIRHEEAFRRLIDRLKAQNQNSASGAAGNGPTGASR